MSTAIHGKASLGEMLLDDGATPARGVGDPSDELNAVDFGATLSGLIVQTISGGNLPAAYDTGPSTGSHGDGKQSATSAVNAKGNDAPTARNPDASPSGHDVSKTNATLQPSAHTSSGSVARSDDSRNFAEVEPSASNSGTIPTDSDVLPQDTLHQASAPPSSGSIARVYDRHQFADAARSASDVSAPQASGASPVATSRQPGVPGSSRSVAKVYGDRKFPDAATSLTSPAATKSDRTPSQVATSRQASAPASSGAVAALYSSHKFANVVSALDGAERTRSDQTIAQGTGSHQISSTASRGSEAKLYDRNQLADDSPPNRVSATKTDRTPLKTATSGQSSLTATSGLAAAVYDDQKSSDVVSSAARSGGATPIDRDVSPASASRQPSAPPRSGALAKLYTNRKFADAVPPAGDAGATQSARAPSGVATSDKPAESASGNTKLYVEHKFAASVPPASDASGTQSSRTLAQSTTSTQPNQSANRGSAAPDNDRKFSEVVRSVSDTGATRTDRIVSQAAAAPAQAKSASTGSAAVLSDKHKFALGAEGVAADKASSTQIESADAAPLTAPVTSKTQPNSSASSSHASAIDDSDPLAAMVAQLSVTPTGDAPVPERDIAFDFRKQGFSSGGVSEATMKASKDFTLSPSSHSTDATPAYIDADAGTPVTPASRNADTVHSQARRASDGTSPAPSTQSASSGSDSMMTGNQKTTLSTSANVIADADAASEQFSAQPALDGLAALAPQDQRERGLNSTKVSPPLTTDAPSAPNGPTGSVQMAQAAAAPQAAAIRQAPEVATGSAPARTVNLTVQLAGGQTAQASVRERAGIVDVKIAAPTAASAQRVSSEIDGLRRNLNAAGMSLGNSEVSYQQSDGGSQEREQYRAPEQTQSANEKDIFVMNEENQ